MPAELERTELEQDLGMPIVAMSAFWVLARSLKLGPKSQYNAFEVLTQRYDTLGNHRRTYSDIAARAGFSHQRARALNLHALRRMRHEYAEHNPEEENHD